MKDSHLSGSNPSQSPGSTIKDLPVEDVHLEKGAFYVVENNTKVFIEAIQMMGKVSDQLLLFPSATGLTISAFNTTKSAYVKASFFVDFFENSHFPDGIPATDNPQYCRIGMKSALNIFKSTSFLRCSLEIDPQSDFMVVHLRQNYEIFKCFVVPLRETTMACTNVFDDKNRLQNKLTIHGKELLHLLTGLDSSEARLIINEANFIAQRFVLMEDFGKVRKTEVTIGIDRFETYQIQRPSQLIINLHDFKAILIFACHVGLSVSLHFDRPGRPMIVAAAENADFSVEFVLATIDGAANNSTGKNVQTSMAPAKQLSTSSINQTSMAPAKQLSTSSINNKGTSPTVKQFTNGHQFASPLKKQQQRDSPSQKSRKSLPPADPQEDKSTNQLQHDHQQDSPLQPNRQSRSPPTQQDDQLANPLQQLKRRNSPLHQSRQSYPLPAPQEDQFTSPLHQQHSPQNQSRLSSSPPARQEDRFENPLERQQRRNSLSPQSRQSPPPSAQQGGQFTSPLQPLQQISVSHRTDDWRPPAQQEDPFESSLQQQHRRNFPSQQSSVVAISPPTRKGNAHIPFQKRILSMSQETIDLADFLANKRILCFESDDEFE